MRRVLIIGAGGIGRRHLQGYAQTGRANLAIVEPDTTRRAEASKICKIEHAYTDIDEVALDSYDLAVICAPAHVHVALMEKCAEANLAFMVEKPLSVTMAGVDAVVALVAKKKLVAHVGYVRRVSTEIQELRAQILAEKIGDLKLVYMNGSQDFPKYRPDFQRTYYAKPEMGGGAILDAASHLLDLLIWLMGKPSEVSCMYDRLVLEGTDTEDTCLINIRFQSGAMANITINQFQKPNTSRLEFIGTKGNLLLEHSRLSFSGNDEAQWPETKEYMEGMVPMEAHQARFAMQAEAMLDALDGKPCHLATLEDAQDNLKIALAAKQSWQQKTIVSLN